MFKISKTKTKKVIRIVESLGLLLWVLLILFNYTSQSTEAAPSIELSAYVVNAKDQGVLDGDYDVRFALYTKDRTASDQSEADSKVWEETQKLTIQNGLIRASLGGLKEFPKELDFSQNQYYLGIKIGDNGEMVPRKKIGSNFFSINAISALNANSAASLNGSVIGIAAGNIPVLATGGTLAPTMLPAITKLGAVSTGTWEADMVASNYIAKALSGKTYNGLTVTASGSEFVLETGANNSLTLSNGALSLSSMGSAGSVAYSDGTKFSFTDQGAAGQVLISNGTSVPYWGDLGSNLIVPDSLDFSELKDSLTLDSNLEISPSAHNYSIDIDGNTFFVDTALNRVGIGTTSPASALEVNGTITASSLSISGNATLGTLGVSGENITSNSSFIPSFTGLNLGSSSNHWAALYVDNLSVSGTDLNGTTAEYFHINTDASSEQSMGIRFYKGSVENGYASIIWDSTSHQFVLYSKESASTLGALTAGNITAGTYNGNTITTGTGTLNLGSYALALTGNSNMDQNLLTTSSPTFGGLTLTNPLTVANGGTGSSNGSITGTGALTLAAGGTNQNITLTPSGSGYTILNGNVGIGTASPIAPLQINGSSSGSNSLLQLGNSNTTSGNAVGISFNPRGTTAGGAVIYGAATVGPNDYFLFFTVGNGSTYQSAALTRTGLEIGDVGNGLPVNALDVSGGMALGSYAGVNAGTGNLIISGNVGIGTTGPGQKLEVSGGILQDSYTASGATGYGLQVNAPTGATANYAASFMGGNVGIGTASPGAKFTVNSAYESTLGVLSPFVRFERTDGTRALQMGYVGGNDLYLGTINAGQGLRFYNDSTVTMFLQNNGNVGIGTTSPSNLLTVNGDVQIGSMSSLSTFQSPQLQINASSAGANNLLVMGNTDATAGNSVSMLFYPRGYGAGTLSDHSLITITGTAGPSTTFSLSNENSGTSYTAMTIDSAGNVVHEGTLTVQGTGNSSIAGNLGIGTTAPAVKLQVNGSAIFSGASTAGIDGEFVYDTTAHAYKYYSSGDSAWHSLGSGTISYSGTLWTQSGSNIYYTGGNVGIGTTTPATGLDVTGVVSAGLGAVGTPSYSFEGDLNTGMWSSGADTLNFSTGGSEKMRVTSTGNVGIGTTGPDTTLKVVGSICAKATDASCAGTTAGIIYADNFVASGTQLTVPDYVFEPNYNLMPLSDLEVYVAANKHLPDMPSESDIQKNGLNYSSMLMGLLQKTEENTLYIIQNNDQFQELTANNQQLTANLGDLTLKTDQNVTTLQGLQASVDEELSKVDSEFKDYDSRITDLENQMGDQPSLIAKLQSQIDELKQKTDQDLNLAQIEANKNDIDLIKLVLGLDRVENTGDVQLLGKLEADGVTAGAFTIKMVENQDPLFGKDKISAGDTKVTIKNKNVSKGSLINITLTSDTQSQAVYVSSQVDGKFEVAVKEKADKDITFNWWIMETNGDSGTTPSSLPAAGASTDTSASTSSSADTTSLDSTTNSPAPAAGPSTTSDTGATAPATTGTGAGISDTGAAVSRLWRFKNS